MVALVHSEHAYISATSTFTPSVAPTAGNLLVIAGPTRDDNDAITTIAGWTIVESVLSSGGSNPVGLSVFYRIAELGDTGWSIGTGQCELSYSEWDAPDAALLDSASIVDTMPATGAFDIAGAVTPGPADTVLIVGALASRLLNDTDTMAVTPEAGVTELDDWGTTPSVNGNPGRWAAYTIDTPASGSYQLGGTRTVGAAASAFAGIVAAFGAAGDVEPEPGEPPPYEPPAAGAAIVEIYVSEPGSDKWDVALWDDGLWAASTWVDIGPWVIFADVVWGVDRPDAGILADTVAGQWVLETHDPERVLDPSNAESQFATELVPRLPIRVRHGGTVVRTGVVQRFWYSFADEGGRISATDGIAGASVARVPEDTVLSDTLYERSREAIAAAGLDMTVGPDPPSGDPPLSPAPEGDFGVWEVISYAAREVLHVPYLDEHGRLLFRPWASPLDRGAVISSPELVDLVTWTSDDELYSVVRVNDYTDMITQERRATPLPPYGERVHERTDPTINGGPWADAVLEDRRADQLRFRPGEVRPLDALSVDALADLEMLELVTLTVPEAVPDVEVRARIVGFRVRVSDETLVDGEVRTRWRWQLLTTLATVAPLIEDGSEPPEYLYADQDPTDPLYPDGVNSL